MSKMRGFFGIGVEGISKEQNVGSIVRTSHAFGASFFFAINPEVNISALRVSDTSHAFDHMPYYQYPEPQQLILPNGCKLIGIEFTDEAVELPSFRHPLCAAYVFGPEMGSLSPQILSRCEHLVKIPMKFCVNVGIASALVMYDRMVCLGKFAERPVRVGGPVIEKLSKPERVHRRRIRRSKSLSMETKITV